MLAQLLAAHGYDAEAVPADAVDSKLLDQIAEKATDSVWISAVAPGGVTHARRLCKRIRPRRGQLTLIVGLWNASGPLEQAEARLKAVGADAVVTEFQQALSLIMPTPSGQPPDASKLEPVGKNL